MVGGPEGLTRFIRAHDDMVTRLDRNEPSLNENAEGDERDTTSPAAMAGLMGRLIFRDLAPESAGKLRGWLNASTTGANRIKAGLPKGWRSEEHTSELQSLMRSSYAVFCLKKKNKQAKRKHKQ